MHLGCMPRFHSLKSAEEAMGRGSVDQVGNTGMVSRHNKLKESSDSMNRPLAVITHRACCKVPGKTEVQHQMW